MAESIRHVTEEDLEKAKGVIWDEGIRFRVFITQGTEAFISYADQQIPDMNLPVLLREGEYYKGENGYFSQGGTKMFPLVTKEAWEEEALTDICFYVPFESLIGKAVLLELDLSKID